MSIYEEAERSYREDCRAADSERAWAKFEDQRDDYAQRDDERQAKYLADSKLGLI